MTSKLLVILALCPFLLFAEIKQSTFSVENMSCPTCPIVIKKALGHLDGVKKIEFSMESKSVTVTFDDSTVTTDELEQAITNSGFPARIKLD